MSYITCENLAIGHDGKAIIKDINFSVNKGEYLFVLGENGAGKSTLMKTILNLIPPIDGKILFGDNLKKNEIGYLPQQTDAQKDFPASVMEIVLSGHQGHMGIRPFYTKKEKELARENIRRMNLSDLTERCFSELSGGQKQRVLLARALCATSKMILMDEPVSGLDPKMTIQMYDTAEELNKEGVTLIMISHDISAAIKYADHILYVGKELFYGTKDEFISDKAGKTFLPVDDCRTER